MKVHRCIQCVLFYMNIFSLYFSVVVVMQIYILITYYTATQLIMTNGFCVYLVLWCVFFNMYKCIFGYSLLLFVCLFVYFFLLCFRIFILFLGFFNLHSMPKVFFDICFCTKHNNKSA